MLCIVCIYLPCLWIDEKSNCFYWNVAWQSVEKWPGIVRGRVGTADEFVWIISTLIVMTSLPPTHTHHWPCPSVTTVLEKSKTHLTKRAAWKKNKNRTLRFQKFLQVLHSGSSYIDHLHLGHVWLSALKLSARLRTILWVALAKLYELRVLSRQNEIPKIF